MKRLVVLASMLLLASCVTAPERKPVDTEVDVPERWVARDALSHTGAVDTDWWDSFGDPELPRLIAVAIEPWTQAFHFQSFAAKDDIAQRQRLLAQRLFGPNQLTKRRRRLIQHRHFFAGQQLIVGIRRATYRKWHDDQPPSVEKRAPKLPHRKVECR